MNARKRDGHDGYRISNLFYLNVFFSVFSSVCVFSFYVISPESDFVRWVIRYVSDWPAIISYHHYALSVFLSAYVKTAPFFGFLWFIFSIGKVVMKGKGDFKKLLHSCLLFPFFYVAVVLFMMFCNHDITESGRFVKYISRNEYFLLIYFACIHFSVSMLTYFLFLFPYVTCLFYKDKKRGHSSP